MSNQKKETTSCTFRKDKIDYDIKKKIALDLIEDLESWHNYAISRMIEDGDAIHEQIALWAVDGERLLSCRLLLESIDA